MLRPASKRRTLRPFSESSLAAQPPEIPEPITIASYISFFAIIRPPHRQHLQLSRQAYSSIRAHLRSFAALKLDVQDGCTLHKPQDSQGLGIQVPPPALP